jgi:hypothetical protein
MFMWYFFLFYEGKALCRKGIIPTMKKQAGETINVVLAWRKGPNII